MCCATRVTEMHELENATNSASSAETLVLTNNIVYTEPSATFFDVVNYHNHHQSSPSNAHVNLSHDEHDYNHNQNYTASEQSDHAASTATQSNHNQHHIEGNQHQIQLEQEDRLLELAQTRDKHQQQQTQPNLFSKHAQLDHRESSDKDTTLLDGPKLSKAQQCAVVLKHDSNTNSLGSQVEVVACNQEHSIYLAESVDYTNQNSEPSRLESNDSVHKSDSSNQNTAHLDQFTDVDHHLIDQQQPQQIYHPFEGRPLDEEQQITQQCEAIIPMNSMDQQISSLMAPIDEVHSIDHIMIECSNHHDSSDHEETKVFEHHSSSPPQNTSNAFESNELTPIGGNHLSQNCNISSACATSDIIDVAESTIKSDITKLSSPNMQQSHAMYSNFFDHSTYLDVELTQLDKPAGVPEPSSRVIDNEDNEINDEDSEDDNDEEDVDDDAEDDDEEEDAEDVDDDHDDEEEDEDDNEDDDDEDDEDADSEDDVDIVDPGKIQQRRTNASEDSAVCTNDCDSEQGVLDGERMLEVTRKLVRNTERDPDRDLRKQVLLKTAIKKLPNFMEYSRYSDTLDRSFSSNMSPQAYYEHHDSQPKFYHSVQPNAIQMSTTSLRMLDLNDDHDPEMNHIERTQMDPNLGYSVHRTSLEQHDYADLHHQYHDRYQQTRSPHDLSNHQNHYEPLNPMISRHNSIENLYQPVDDAERLSDGSLKEDRRSIAFQIACELYDFSCTPGEKDHKLFNDLTNGYCSRAVKQESDANTDDEIVETHEQEGSDTSSSSHTSDDSANSSSSQSAASDETANGTSLLESTLNSTCDLYNHHSSHDSGVSALFSPRSNKRSSSSIGLDDDMDIDHLTELSSCGPSIKSNQYKKLRKRDIIEQDPITNHAI